MDDHASGLRAAAMFHLRGLYNSTLRPARHAAPVPCAAPVPRWRRSFRRRTIRLRNGLRPWSTHDIMHARALPPIRGGVPVTDGLARALKQSFRAFSALVALSVAARAPSRPSTWRSCRTKPSRASSSTSGSTPPIRRATKNRRCSSSPGSSRQRGSRSTPRRRRRGAATSGRGSRAARSRRSCCSATWTWCRPIPKYWTCDPFAATVKDGVLWGRGTLDTKTLGIVELEAFLALHRAQDAARPRRDLHGDRRRRGRRRRSAPAG